MIQRRVCRRRDLEKHHDLLYTACVTAGPFDSHLMLDLVFVLDLALFKTVNKVEVFAGCEVFLISRNIPLLRTCV